MTMNIVQRSLLYCLFAVACSVLITHDAVRAQDSGIEATIISIDDDAYPQARAIISIENTAAEAGSALTKEQFAATVDGQPANIVSADLVTSESAPLDLLLIVDVSGTTEGLPLAAAKNAAKALLAELAPEDRVAVMSFSDAPVLLQDYTADRTLVTGAIDRLTSGGNTALYQATAAAAVLSAQSAASRRAVILLSDAAGEYGNKSIATREEAIAAAAAAGVPFFAIAQGSGEDLAYFTQLAEVTRGRSLEAAGPSDLEALYVSIGKLLKSQYTITFDASAASIEDGSTVAITVMIDGQSGTAEARYQPGAGFLPVIDVQGLTAGETILEPREVRVNVSSGTPLVTWYVDDVNVMELDAPPYVYTFEPRAFEGGDHRLRVAVGDGPSRVETGISFSSVKPASSGGSPMLLYGLVALAMVVGAAAFVLLKRRKPRDRSAPIPADQRLKSWASQVAEKASAAEPPVTKGDGAQEDIGVAMGRLVSRAGNDAGSEYLVGGKPVSIGAGAACGVRIADPDLATEEARIWVRGEHLMYHKFTRLTSLEAEGVAGGWQILEPGDTFTIGQHTFEFKLLERAADGSAPSGGDAPRTRLSDLMPRAD
jgi:VWFA-related protein